MRQRLILVAGVIAYIWILSAVYVDRVAPVWAYEGSRYSPPPEGLQPLTWALAVLPSVWMPIGLQRPSQLIYWILYVVVYVPACLLPIFAVTIAPASLLTFQTCLAAAFFCLGRIYQLPLVDLPRPHTSPIAFWFGLGLFSTMCYALILSTSGLRLSLVSVEDVYDVRADYANTIQEYGPLLVYAVSWQVSLVNPVLMAVGLAGRHALLAVLGVAAQLLMYSITGFKTALFSGIILLLIVVLLGSRRRWVGIKLVGSVVLLILGAVGVDAWTDSNLWTAIFVNRIVIMPGLLTGYYFEFFSQNPQALLGDSILRSFVTYPYELSVPALIGSVYIQGAWANANVWADAYANLGYFGLLAVTLLLATVLHLFDSAAVDLEPTCPALLAASVGWTFSNGGLLTSLLTNGIGFLLLVLYLMPRAGQHTPVGEAALRVAP